MERIFTNTENGFSMTSNKVAIPACRIKAHSYEDASKILTRFLCTKEKPDCLELITPIERIDFD